MGVVVAVVVAVAVGVGVGVVVAVAVAGAGVVVVVMVVAVAVAVAAAAAAAAVVEQENAPKKTQQFSQQHQHSSTTPQTRQGGHSIFPGGCPGPAGIPRPCSQHIRRRLTRIAKFRRKHTEHRNVWSSNAATLLSDFTPP